MHNLFLKFFGKEDDFSRDEKLEYLSEKNDGLETLKEYNKEKEKDFSKEYINEHSSLQL